IIKYVGHANFVPHPQLPLPERREGANRFTVYVVWFTIHRSLTNMTISNPTPMLRQYQELKLQHPGTLLFFRLGDFYELFFDDAVTGSRELQITLTARHKERGDPIPMC